MPTAWTFQREVEAALYGNGYANQTGAVYQLLRRSGVGSRSLSLKKASVAQGLVTQHEFEWLSTHLGDVRSFTLIPVPALETALERFGRSDRSEALVAALELTRPQDWQVSEEEEEEGEEDEVGEDEEEEDRDDEHDADDDGGRDGDGDGDGGHDGDGESGGDGSNGDKASVAGTEPLEEPIIVGTGSDEDQAAPPAPADSSPPSAGHSTKRQAPASIERLEITPTLEAQLAAFDAHRAAPLNQARKGAAVAQATREKDRERIIRFLGWVSNRGMLRREPTLTIFAHAFIGKAVERYVETHVQDEGRKYSYLSNCVGSFLAAARFVVAQRRGQDPSDAVETLAALHRQCLQQATRESKFTTADKPAAWLDWDAIQRVRVAAEKALAEATTPAATLRLTADVTTLRLLADQPPDRVGVTRLLKLGSSLKRLSDGSYELDVGEDSHKTAHVFGATRTTINASIASWLDRYIELGSIPDGGYLFHARENKHEAVSPSAWTGRVKAIFSRHGDVALCPKDARSSFITFLRSGEHDDEAVKAAAVAMRHSSKTQASAAYDKGASDRRVSAAMKVAADFSATFKAPISNKEGKKRAR